MSSGKPRRRVTVESGKPLERKPSVFERLGPGAPRKSRDDDKWNKSSYNKSRSKQKSREKSPSDLRHKVSRKKTRHDSSDSNSDEDSDDVSRRDKDHGTKLKSAVIVTKPGQSLSRVSQSANTGANNRLYSDEEDTKHLEMMREQLMNQLNEIGNDDDRAHARIFQGSSDDSDRGHKLKKRKELKVPEVTKKKKKKAKKAKQRYVSSDEETPKKSKEKKAAKTKHYRAVNYSDTSSSSEEEDNSYRKTKKERRSMTSKEKKRMRSITPLTPSPKMRPQGLRARRQPSTSSSSSDSSSDYSSPSPPRKLSKKKLKKGLDVSPRKLLSSPLKGSRSKSHKLMMSPKDRAGGRINLAQSPREAQQFKKFSASRKSTVSRALQRRGRSPTKTYKRERKQTYSSSSQDDSSESPSVRRRPVSSKRGVDSSRSGDRRLLASSQKHKSLSSKQDRALAQKAAMRSRGLKSAAATSLAKAKGKLASSAKKSMLGRHKDDKRGATSIKKRPTPPRGRLRPDDGGRSMTRAGGGGRDASKRTQNLSASPMKGKLYGQKRMSDGHRQGGSRNMSSHRRSTSPQQGGGPDRLKRLAGYDGPSSDGRGHRGHIDDNFARMNSSLDRHGRERKQMVHHKGELVQAPQARMDDRNPRFSRKDQWNNDNREGHQRGWQGNMDHRGPGGPGGGVVGGREWDNRGSYRDTSRDQSRDLSRDNRGNGNHRMMPSRHRSLDKVDALERSHLGGSPDRNHSVHSERKRGRDQTSKSPAPKRRQMSPTNSRRHLSPTPSQRSDTSRGRMARRGEAPDISRDRDGSKDHKNVRESQRNERSASRAESERMVRDRGGSREKGTSRDRRDDRGDRKGSKERSYRSNREKADGSHSSRESDRREEGDVTKRRSDVVKERDDVKKEQSSSTTGRKDNKRSRGSVERKEGSERRSRSKEVSVDRNTSRSKSIESKGTLEKKPKTEDIQDAGSMKSGSRPATPKSGVSQEVQKDSIFRSIIDNKSDDFSDFSDEMERDIQFQTVNDKPPEPTIPDKRPLDDPKPTVHDDNRFRGDQGRLSHDSGPDQFRPIDPVHHHASPLKNQPMPYMSNAHARGGGGDMFHPHHRDMMGGPPHMGHRGMPMGMDHNMRGPMDMGMDRYMDRGMPMGPDRGMPMGADRGMPMGADRGMPMGADRGMPPFGQPHQQQPSSQPPPSLGEVKPSNDYEEISDDDLDNIIGPDDQTEQSSNADESKKEEKPAEVVDILDIPWASVASMEESKAKKPPMSRFSPVSIFSRIGVSRQFAGAALVDKIKAKCQAQLNEEAAKAAGPDQEGDGYCPPACEKFELLNDVAMLHVVAVKNKLARSSLISNIGSYRRALCSYKDLQIRRKLCGVNVDHDTGNMPILPQTPDTELYNLSLKLLKKEAPFVTKRSSVCV